MLNYTDYLESKNVGILYHFTGLISLYNIQKYNYLESIRTVDSFENLMKSYGLENKSDWHYISFTRNKNFHKTGQMMMDNFMSCRMSIDGNSLSNKYKIFKVNYFPDRTHKIKEAEECVVVRYELKDIMDYVMRIEIPKFERFLEEILYNLNMKDNFVWYFKNTLEEFDIDLNENLDEPIDFDDLSEDVLGEELKEISKYESAYRKLYDTLVDDIQYDGYLL